MTWWGAIKKTMSEALPFVARSPALQVEWLVEEIRRARLSDRELAPYLHLLLSGHQTRKETGEEDGLRESFVLLPRESIAAMIRCAEIYDLPELLPLIPQLTVKEAIMALKKEPPPYEKRYLLLLDRIFQAINSGGEHLLERAGEKMLAEGEAPAHFASAYERFKEILIDEGILASLYPQAKG